METIIARLTAILDTWPEVLRQMPGADLENKPSAGKWSKKEILGHLIDSAANNHQRFVRLQYEEATIAYDQDQWVAVSRYQDALSEDLIMLWEAYNRHLLHLIRSAGDRMQQLQPASRQSLEYFIEDYVRHLEHHLGQIDPYFAV